MGSSFRIVIAAVLLIALPFHTAYTQRYGVQVNVNANGHQRSAKPVEVELNFTALLSGVGVVGSLSSTSIRVREINSTGATIDAEVDFQFDPDSAFHPTTNARGILTFLMKGATAPTATRLYRILFDTASGFTLPTFSNRIAITDSVQYQGQQSYRIATPIATYYYHKLGGGFASMLDLNANDWISYRPGGGSAGEFRGIPNLGVCAHPGYTNGTSRIVSQGPLKATILSRTNDNGWQWKWDIFPEYARMTLMKRAANFWILYEGTPGGLLEPNSDFWVRSSGERLLLSQSWFGDIPYPEWVYFGDRALRRVLYLAHHNDDNLQDIFYQMENNMTVFGFGRQWQCCDRYLTQIPTRLTIGFAEDSLMAAQTINGAFENLSITFGQPVINSATQADGIPTEFTLHQNYPNPFNPITTIAFRIQSAGLVTLKVYDMLGREARTLMNEVKEAGEHSVSFHAAGLSSGVYFYRLHAGGRHLIRPMVLLQ